MIKDNYPISKQLLSDFIDNFFGYGNINSPYWFIGKEEGGGKTIEENYNRIKIWEKLGKTSTVDSIDYHHELGFGEELLSKIQPTWTKLIQILIEIEGRDSTSKDIRRHFQRHHLGRTGGSNACLELMPMASRSTGLWLWRQLFADYFGYEDRKQYFKAVVPKRRQRLKQLVNLHQPKLALFYSTQADYQEEWNKISGVKQWEWVEISKYFKYGWAKLNNTLFVITPHPTAHGLKITDFPQVGKFIKNKL